MKKLIYLLVIVAVGYWLYGKCSGGSSDEKVLKQVMVSANTANLRTGPGTNYDVVTDSTGTRCQVARGTMLDVVGQKSGWYKVRLPGNDSETAYIKQSLCTSPNTKKAQQGSSRSSRQDNGQSETADETPGTATEYSVAEPSPSVSSSPERTSSSTATEDDFEEEVEEAEFIPKTR